MVCRRIYILGRFEGSIATAMSVTSLKTSDGENSTDEVCCLFL